MKQDVMTERLILVADDDVAVGRVLTRMLARQGFGVVLVHDGAKAIAAVQAQRARFVCVLLDVVMPMVDGVVAAQTIQQLAPELPVLLMSGYVPPDLVQPIARLRLGEIIHKPFTAATLAARIHATCTAPMAERTAGQAYADAMADAAAACR